MRNHVKNYTLNNLEYLEDPFLQLPDIIIGKYFYV